MSQDRVAIIGSGGIGGYLAAELVGGGRDVTMCVRTPFDRLVIESGGTTRTVDVRQATSPGELGRARWILVTTKAQDSAGAKPWIDAVADAGSVVVMVQNGIDHLARAEPIAGACDVLPAIIYCSVERDRPGHLVHHGASRMVVPQGEAGAAFVGLFAGTGFQVEQTDDFRTVAWRKLFNNLVGNAVTGITARRMALFQNPKALALARAILEEALVVAQADGARLTQAELEQAHAGLSRFGQQAGTSMLYDRLAGRPLEHDHITGALVEAADRHGIPVPVNRTLLALLDTVSGHRLDELR